MVRNGASDANGTSDAIRATRANGAHDGHVHTKRRSGPRKEGRGPEKKVGAPKRKSGPRKESRGPANCGILVGPV